MLINQSIQMRCSMAYEIVILTIPPTLRPPLLRRLMSSWVLIQVGWALLVLVNAYQLSILEQK